MYMYVHMYVYMYVYMYVCLYVCMHIGNEQCMVEHGYLIYIK
jgi:hypothetical protein